MPMSKKADAAGRIRCLADLQAVKQRQAAAEARAGARIVVGLGTCGMAAGARQVYEAFRAELAALGLQDVVLEPTGCVGICQFEPVVEVYQPGGRRTTYVRMTPERAVRVVRQHVLGGNPLAEFTIGADRNRR